MAKLGLILCVALGTRHIAARSVQKVEKHQNIQEEQLQKVLNDKELEDLLDGDDLELDDVSREDDTGLFYHEYLMKITEILRNDRKFFDRLSNLDQDEIMNGNTKIDLHKFDMKLKKELDKEKRTEIMRIKHIIKAQEELEGGGKISENLRHKYLEEIAGHFHHDTHSFEEIDLIKLMKAANKDLDEFDEARHDRFKNYEMYRKRQHDKKVEGMSSEEKRKYEAALEAEKNKHKDHEPIHFPGSEEQMKQIWEDFDEEDGPFESDKFFVMHDKNSDGYLDPQEVEDLMDFQLRGVYEEGHKEDHMPEKEEEKLRMREQVYKEMDSNKDDMISKKEWLSFTADDWSEHALEDKYGKWESVDDMIEAGHVYTESDLKEYQKEIDQQEAQYQKLIATFERRDRKFKKKSDRLLEAKAEMEEQGVHEDEEAKAYIAKKEKDLKERGQELSDLGKQMAELVDNIDAMKKDHANHSKLSSFKKLKDSKDHLNDLGNFEKRRQEAERIVMEMKKQWADMEKEAEKDEFEESLRHQL